MVEHLSRPIKPFKPMSDREREWHKGRVLREYERLGQEPVYAGDLLVSPGLAETIRGRS